MDGAKMFEWNDSKHMTIVWCYKPGEMCLKTAPDEPESEN
jgi:hypothetical protein